MSSMRIPALAALAGTVWLCSALAVHATVTATKDSADFNWKYEMDVDPLTDDQDLDSFFDWAGGTAGATASQAVAGGVLTQYTMDGNSHTAYAGTNAIWDSSFSLATGWTIEASIKVVSEYPGAAAATVIWGHFQGADHLGALNIHATGQVMGNFGPTSGWDTVGNGTEDNTDAFHVFRMTQSPGEDKYSIWRDGVLLLDDQPSVAKPWVAAGEDVTWLLFGDIGGAYGGEVQYEYFRFTQGAFAPVSPAVSGDYNNNGAVDAADYVMWRKQFGQNGPGLASDGTGPGGTPDGSVDNLDYTFWRAHFGEPSGVGSASGAGSITSLNVPEPATLSLLFALSLMSGFRSRSRRLAGR